MISQTLFEKIWDEHVIEELGDDLVVLHVDLHWLHDIAGSGGLKEIEHRGIPVRNPELAVAVPDHMVSSQPGRTGGDADWSQRRIDQLRSGCKKWGIPYFDVNDREQGIVHVIGPELGITQPGILLVCGDSHTSTHGALGALAWGIGSSEVFHVLATQTIVQRRPRTMRVNFSGRLQPGVEAKDLILYLIGREGVAAANGYAVEYAGSTIDEMDMEGRMTLCNLSIEWGAKIGMIAPDELTCAWLSERPYAPRGRDWESARAYWASLYSDNDARFDHEIHINAEEVSPQITWGTSPQDTMSLDACVPFPSTAAHDQERNTMQQALDYMGLTPGTPIAGTPVDRVFIGSCTNGRLGDLRRCVELIRRSGMNVARHVRAWVVPGSKKVKSDAETEGLHRIFLDAGFEWREPGCSLCAGSNGDLLSPGERCVSTSNRNFVGRQGPLSRTHLASPVTAAASALAGKIIDARNV